MKEDEVPQDVSPNYGGQRKLFYAVDERGDYNGVRSAGWEVETAATQAAIDAVNRQRDDAWARARRGDTAPLEFHMYRRRMDLALLAQTSGVWQWRIRRHFNPRRFARLSPRLLSRYADALGLTIEEIRRLPDNPDTML